MLVAQSCPTLFNTLDYSQQDSSVHGMGICLTQGLNLGLPRCRQTFLPSESPGKPQAFIGVTAPREKPVLFFFFFFLLFIFYFILFFFFLENSLLDSVGEGEGGMFQENSIETCILDA